MPRPSKQIRRDHQLNLGLTKDEFVDAYYRAERAGMRLVDYGRWRLLGGNDQPVKPAAAKSTADRLLSAELRRIGNNLNQMVRFCHSAGHPPPSHLDSLLLHIRSLLGGRART